MDKSPCEYFSRRQQSYTHPRRKHNHDPQPCLLHHQKRMLRFLTKHHLPSKKELTGLPRHICPFALNQTIAASPVRFVHEEMLTRGTRISSPHLPAHNLDLQIQPTTRLQHKRAQIVFLNSYNSTEETEASTEQNHLRFCADHYFN